MIGDATWESNFLNATLEVGKLVAEGMLSHNNFDSFIYFHNSGLTNFRTFQDYFISFA
jgi:hypothetical protein